MTLQLRHLTPLLVAFLFLIFLPCNAAGECLDACHDLFQTFKPCGTCDPQPATQCGGGCTCSFCSTSYGQCNCGNRLHNYSTDGLSGSDGACECGNARVHVRQHSFGRAEPATQLGNMLPASEEVMLVPDRCTRAYRILRLRISSLPPGGN